MTKRTYTILAIVAGVLAVAVFLLMPGFPDERFRPEGPTLIAALACVTILAAIRATRR